MLVQLVYTSNATRPLSETQVREIASHSARRNAPRAVTGLLLFSRGNFLQVLEGEEPVIRDLYAKIGTDPRHTGVMQLVLKPITKRLYPDWHMGLADLAKPLTLDRGRMLEMIDDVRSRSETSGLSVEARMLVNDFRAQLQKNAA